MMTPTTKTLAGTAMATALMTCASALAGSLTWDGGVSNSWNTTESNWTGDATNYTDGDDVLFDSTTSGEITGIVSRSPNSTTVDSPNKVTFTTGIFGNTKPIGGPSILTGALIKNGSGELELGDPLLGQQFGPAADRNKYSNSFSSISVTAGTLRIRSRAALGTGTVTLAGGTRFIQASEEGRFHTNNEHIDNDFVLSGGLVEFPMAFGNDNKGVWIRNGTVSGPGGIKVTGSSRSLSFSADNTFSGGVVIETNATPSVIIGSYTALGTGTFTASQSSSSGGGLSAGIDLPGNTSHPDGVTNPIVITSGNFFNVRCSSGTATLRLAGDISGAGTLHKWSNDSTVIISGTNTYTGGTIISDGALICEGPESLGEGPLTIASGALLQLDFIGSRNVPTLTIGGVARPNGTYGASGSPAENQDDLHFAGTGMVVVGPPKSPTTTGLAQTGCANPADIGSLLTYTATVAGASPTGQVTFYDRDNVIGTSALDGSFQARITTSSLPAGPRTITAEYLGDAGNQPSADTYAQVIDPPAGNGKLKVFILAGQSNMQGHGKLEMGRDPEDPTGPLIEGGLGTLRNATAREPKKFGYLQDPGNPVDGHPGWTTRNDVWISCWDGLGGNPNATTVERRAGFLDAGFGIGASLADERIGPEYGFGQVGGGGLSDEVLIIKTAWGGKSLQVDFRPPSSGGTKGGTTA